MSNLPRRLPLTVITDAVDAAVTHLAKSVGISQVNARVTLAQLNETFDLFGPTHSTTKAPAAGGTLDAITIKQTPAKAPTASTTKAPDKAPTPVATPSGRKDGRGELTAAILAALPDSASNIAAKIGKPVTSVNSTLSRLSERGTVTRSGSRGSYVYSVSEPEEREQALEDKALARALGRDTVAETKPQEAPAPVESPQPEPEPQPETPPAAPQEPQEAPPEPEAVPTPTEAPQPATAPTAPQEASIDDLFYDSADDAAPTTPDNGQGDVTIDDLTATADLLEVGDEG